jgi:glycerol-3-phosphate dehydrogenase
MVLGSEKISSMADYDLAVIGGGINGAGIARDAAGRGIRVLLVEQNDLASGTSSASTKLIHGGLRYLEHGAFRLVRESLAEREVLWRMAPHIIRPMRFVLPTDAGLRSPLLMRIGLLLYDRLGGRELLPPTSAVDLTHHPVGVPLKRSYRSAFEYSDCRVDDVRLVVLNAIDAAERGATIRPRTRCVRAEREKEWRLILKARGERDVVTARVLVNAAGPWVGSVAETVLRTPLPAPARLVKGSHIVVPRLFDHDRGYILPGPDRRFVFALPFQRDFTLIGTTDDDFTGDPAAVTTGLGEIDYLCQSVSAYFREAVGPEKVLHTYAGVRALYDDGAARAKDATRDYRLMLDRQSHAAPLLTVYGGKITTYRRLAEATLRLLGDCLRGGPAWTATAPLPGGDFAVDGVRTLVARARRSWPFLTEPQAERLVGAYGTRLPRVLGNDEIAPWFGADLSSAEVRYLMKYEWAQTADDVLWRRSKLGLSVSEAEKSALARFMQSAVEQASV